MTKEQKEIKEVQDDIAERLSFSNPSLWKSLGQESKEKIIKKYIDLRDESKIHLEDLLEKDFVTRQQLILLVLGLLLGIVGNLFSDAFLINLKRITDDGLLYVVICFVIFFVIIKILFKFIQKNSGDNLKRNKVLEKLLELTKKED